MTSTRFLLGLIDASWGIVGDNQTLKFALSPLPRIEFELPLVNSDAKWRRHVATEF